MAKLLWTEKQDIGPKPRWGHALAFDTAAQRVLLFGGQIGDGTPMKDTWSWDGQDWTQLEDIGPAARFGHATAYDTSRNRLVLFGGTAGGSDFGDTWEWDGTSWTQIQDVGPSARFGHAMAFDAARGVVVLFGGAHAGGGVEQDTWTWNGSDWQQVEETGPSARRGHTMAFDSVRGRTVLFGGSAAQTGSFGDTWEWDGQLWKHVQDIGPGPTTEAAMVFRTSVCALFGGISALAANVSPTVFGLTWEWDGAHWTARQDIGVGARFGHAMAFDTVRGRAVLFGGLTAVPPPEAVTGDTWEHADTGGGAPPPTQGGNSPVTTIPVVSITAAPNPAGAGDLLTLQVQIAQPAPAQGATVVLSGDFGDLGAVVVQAGSTTGAQQIPIPPDLASMMPLPTTGNITATSGGTTVQVALTFH